MFFFFPKKIAFSYQFKYFYQVLVCAPSNVAVDQLAEKISATGLNVKFYQMGKQVIFFYKRFLLFFNASGIFFCNDLPFLFPFYSFLNSRLLGFVQNQGKLLALLLST